MSDPQEWEQVDPIGCCRRIPGRGSGRAPPWCAALDGHDHHLGPLDELIALHIELGVFEALDRLPVRRERAGIDYVLLLRTLAVLPFLAEPGLDPSARLLFQEPAILLRLGWAPTQIQAGDHHRHRHPEDRQAESLPCHPDTLRDAFRRIETAAWSARAGDRGVLLVRPSVGPGARSTRPTAAAWATTTA